MKPVKMKLGTWVEMEYDKKITIFGVDWWRVKGGMDGGGDREDWVADIPGVGVCVHDCQWRNPRWGPVKAKSFGEACKIALQDGVGTAERYVAECVEKLTTVNLGLRILREAVQA